MNPNEDTVTSSVDFDDYSQDYEQLLNSGVSIFGEDCSYFDKYKLKCLDEYSLISGDRSILDFGCGTGRLARLIAQSSKKASVIGHDVSKGLVEVAKRKGGLEANLEFVEDISDGLAFDTVVAANVFHHIPPADRKEVLIKLMTVLKKDGVLAVFEHNPVNLVTRYVVKTCQYDKGAELISCRALIDLASSCGFEVLRKRYIVFFPRWLGCFRPAEKYIGFMPVGAQYFVMLSKKGRLVK